MEPDDELVERCRIKDDEAWTKLVRRYWRQVFGLCLRATGREEESEDLTQEIFLKVYKAIEGFDGRRASFTTWVYRVARNHLVDYHRCTRNDRITFSIEDELPRLERSNGREEHPPDPLEHSERRRVLRTALDQLSPHLREAVVLRDLEGLEYREVSAALRIPSGTAKSRVHRARLELGRVLNAQRDELLQRAPALSY